MNNDAKHQDRDMTPEELYDLTGQRAPDAMADRQARIDYLKSIAPAPKPKRIWLRILITLIIVGIIGGGAAYYWFSIRKTTPVKPVATTTKKVPAVTTPQKITVVTKHYDASASVGLGFDYPEKWTVADVVGSGQVTITSPATQLKSDSGKLITGQIVATIHTKQASIPAFDKGNAVAVRTSEKIDYTRPSQVQRASTYLSFLNYASSASSTSLDGIYVTGDHGYQKDQAVPKTDIVTADPLITITFLACNDAKCANPTTQVGISATVWDDLAFTTPLTTILKSIVVAS